MRDNPTARLFFDDVHEAIAQLVRDCGGPKHVASALWPAMTLKAATDQLAHAIDPERREKLTLDELMFVMRLAREKGSHGFIRQLCRDVGYTEPSPLEPADERAALQREFIGYAKRLDQLAKRIEGFR